MPTFYYGTFKGLTPLLSKKDFYKKHVIISVGYVENVEKEAEILQSLDEEFNDDFLGFFIANKLLMHFRTLQCINIKKLVTIYQLYKKRKNYENITTKNIDAITIAAKDMLKHILFYKRAFITDKNILYHEFC